jgi:hypothetical protein
MCYIIDSEQSIATNNMDADSDKSLHEELNRITTGQNGLSESDAGPALKVCLHVLLEITNLCISHGITNFYT